MSPSSFDKLLAVVGIATALDETEGLGVGFTVEALATRQVLESDDGSLAVILARAVRGGAEDQVVDVVGRSLLEIDGVTAIFVQASRVVAADSLAWVLSAGVVVIERSINDGVARRQDRGSGDAGGDAEGNSNDGCDVHLEGLVDEVSGEVHID
jgi:hypothetical protein